MPKLSIRTIDFLIGIAKKTFLRQRDDYKRIRIFDITEPSVLLVGKCLLRQDMVGKVNTYTLVPKKPSNPNKIIYLHGGAFISGPVLFHWEMLGRLCELTGSEIIVVLYRKSPEFPYPAQMEDLLAVYDHYMRSNGPGKICLMGDSAGGGLVAATALKLRDENRPLPAKLVLLSPWLDITLSNPDITRLEKDDKFLSREGVAKAGVRYAIHHDPKHPYLSPVYGDLRDLPETLLLVGTKELLLFDCRKFRDKALAAGVSLQYVEWKDMFHDWVCLTLLLSEAEEALQLVAGFLNS
jgi:acetyl esterase/lipase